MLQKIFTVDDTSTDKKNAADKTTIRDREVELSHAIVDAMAMAVDEIHRRRQVEALQDCIF